MKANPGPSTRGTYPMGHPVQGGGSIHTAHPVPSYPNQVGIYGWRKRCLYMLLVILVITVILNLALTIWILRVMDFNVDGMGKLRIVKDGIKVDGDATFLKSLYATQITSLKDSNLNINSSQHITLTARRSKDSGVTNQVYLGDKKFVVHAKRFQVRDPSGKRLFAVSGDGVTLGASTLEVNGTQGTVFKSSVETPLLRSQLNSDLRLDSSTGGVYMTAAEDVTIRTPVGDMKLISQADITLQSLNHAIRLDSKNISLAGLPVSKVNNGNAPFPLVYQLCVCASNGKLFLSEADSFCVATVQICS